LGGGFNQGAWASNWRPGNRADTGHNLTTLFGTAQYAINTD